MKSAVLVHEGCVCVVPVELLTSESDPSGTVVNQAVLVNSSAVMRLLSLVFTGASAMCRGSTSVWARFTCITVAGSQTARE